VVAEPGISLKFYVDILYKLFWGELAAAEIFRGVAQGTGRGPPHVPQKCAAYLGAAAHRNGIPNPGEALGLGTQTLTAERQSRR
jgi:hypothetical protein